MELARPREALAEYRLALSKEPNRYWSLVGAMKAAIAARDTKAAQRHATQIQKLTGTTP